MTKKFELTDNGQFIITNLTTNTIEFETFKGNLSYESSGGRVFFFAIKEDKRTVGYIYSNVVDGDGNSFDNANDLENWLDNILTISDFSVEKLVTHTECASIFTYNINATDLDDIDITLTGEHENEYIVLNGVESSFTDTKLGIAYDTSLSLHFIVQNSDNPGVFDSTEVEIENNTESETYTDTAVREDDSPKCISATGSDYDSLTDTPGTKTGSALKYVRVNAAETAHEYVTAPTDAHYEHDQATPSNSWIVNHNLGKYPSVTVVDTAGELLWAAVDHTNNNSLTISFNASTSGKAYLN